MCQGTIKIKLEILEDVQCHEHWATIDYVIYTTIELIVFKK